MLFSAAVQCCGVYLEDGEVLQNTVHHVLLWQVFELVDEVDHVLTHGGAMDPKHTLSPFHPRVLRLKGTQTQFSQAEKSLLI